MDKFINTLSCTNIQTNTSNKNGNAMNIQDIFTNFLAIDTIEIKNISTIEKFCYEKINLEPTDLGQSNMSKLELTTLFSSVTLQIESRLSIIKNKFKFKDHLQFKIGRSWINLNQNNNVTKPHLHANSLFSGILYIKCKNSGPIVFVNPIVAHQYVINSDIIQEYNKFTSADMSVIPEVGKLIIFPSWLVHYIENNLDNTDRISIAFNVDIVKS